MTTLHRNQRATHLAVLLAVLFPGLRAYAGTSHSDAWARDKFVLAERLREALNGRPVADRTRRDYQRVIDAYRRIYFGAPVSSKADPSVVAVAELKVEMGRRFEDDRILRAAVKQYEFLRREYPGSKYRFDALFTIGEIYKDDLDDPEQAKATFSEFLRRYPRNRLADDARQAIAELNQVAKESEEHTARQEAVQREAERYQRAADLPVEDASSNPAADGGRPEPDLGKPEAEGEEDAGSGKASRQLPRVTMIRHWSTPDYTRVAIDLEQDVKFGSQRIDHPDRIYFDLYNTKLASTLVGKSFDVDDGFLKKVRVAQYKPELTRVVLEVDSFSAYDAFLLSNPSRLIIDIHGKQSTKSGRETTARAAKAGDRAAAEEAMGKTSVKDSSVDGTVELAAARTSSSPGQTLSSEPAETGPAGEPRKPGVVHTMNGKIPKTIVEADDLDESSAKPQPVANPRVEDLRPEVAPPVKNRPASEAAGLAAGSAERRLSSSSDRSKRGSLASIEELDAREAKPTASGDRSLTRVLGLKIGKIVIDPGHGGHDTGTIGPHGLREKDLVLDVGRRLGKLLETRLGAEVVYTRRDDTFIPLETRTAIANKQQADLFVSIHANSSHDPAARGVETYYLNFTSSPDALEVAARENAVSEKSIHELGDLVKKIALKEKIEESHEFASDVQSSLQSGLYSGSSGMRDRGVKKAPFIVLIGANMPSILAEISFVSNPTDEHKLETSEYRQHIAEALYRGIAKYAGGLSGIKVASREAKNEGQ
ncbi:MAG TPA: N-acetylmuramoyl-L-alanine amidase [Terriglobales bacterium]|nr:N-acetylmuramoyl-L-alanine amidase [Terriglobales bacterium]